MHDVPHSASEPPASLSGSAAGDSRRSLLKKGLVGGAILAVGGAIPLLLQSTRITQAPSQPLRCLSPAEHAIFAAVAARVCPGAAAARSGHPNDDSAAWPKPAALACAEKVDGLMAGLHPSAAADFRKLLRVFESSVTGLFCIGSPATFTASAAADQDRRLNAWRSSRVALFRSGYQAMKRLAHATYYASPETYSRVGYPGPPVVPQIPS